MKLFINVGDASADVYGAEIIRELKKLEPEIEIHANGGKLMEAAGGKLFCNLVDFSVIGISEAVKKYFPLMKIIKGTANYIKKNNIRTAVLVDYPGFNLRLAKLLKKNGIKVIYYILPQVWAWNEGRIKIIKETVEQAIVLFPFEKAIYEKVKVPVKYFGHPLFEAAKPSKSKKDLRAEFNLPSDKIVIGLFPGSRRQEIETILPEMVKLVKNYKDVEYILCRAPVVSPLLINKHLCGLPLKVIAGRAYDVMEASDIAVFASGTVTLEGALMKKPMINVYKLSKLTEFIFRRTAKVSYATLPNIIAGKLIVPELLQGRANAKEIEAEIKKILEKPAVKEKMLFELQKLSDSLKGEKIMAKTAEAILKCVKSS
ncbi:MAG: lipid-A-disaccharide synthase [Candidatus Firestonebacteria bacterium]